jgi:Xaa-Pro aminopeptidase
LSGLNLRYRIRRLKEELKKRGLDTFIAVQNTRYLAGTTAGKAVIVPADGEPVLICSRLELEQAKRESSIRDIRAFSGWKAPLQRGERVYFLRPWQLITECLKKFEARAVGFDNLGLEALRKIRCAHDASYHELPELVLDLRKVKSRQELSWLKHSAEIAVKGMRCAAELIEAGRTELEIAAGAEHTMRLAGSEGTSFDTIVASGRNSRLPHATATRKKLRRGDLVVVDLGAKYNGYASDMTRTFAINPSRKQLKLIKLVRKAQQFAIGKVKDGANASTIDRTARGTIGSAGYARFYSHGTGHGVGLDIHEPPSLAPESKDILKRGMVITVEPGLYLPWVGGARWEDMLEVTQKGYRLLTHEK